MKKKNNNTIWIIILILLAIALIIGGYFFASKSFNTTTKEDNTDKTSSYKKEDYITIEKVNMGSEIVSIEKVIFKNLDSSLTQKFTEEQTKLIDSAKETYDYFETKHKNGEPYPSETVYLAESTIWYQINNNILTVHYTLTSVNEIGVGNQIAVTNIDLKNNKVLTNEEILELGNSNFNAIATKEYNRVLNECTNQAERDYCYVDKNEKKVTLEEHQKNKDRFINNLELKLDEIIKAYIQDNKVKYDYNIGIRLVNEYLAMGGPFPYETSEVGDFK